MAFWRWFFSHLPSSVLPSFHHLSGLFGLESGSKVTKNRKRWTWTIQWQYLYDKIWLLIWILIWILKIKWNHIQKMDLKSVILHHVTSKVPRSRKNTVLFADVLHPSGVLPSTNIPTLPPPQLAERELPSRKSPYPGHRWPVGESEMILAVTQSQVTPSWESYPRLW